MKYLKMFLIIIVIIIAIPLIMAIFIKKEYTITRGISISKPSDSVYNYIKYLKNQEQYSKWVMTDPAMRKKLTGTDGTVGFIYAWDSDNKQAGKGEQEITKLVDGRQVDAEIRFIKPFEGIARTEMITTANGASETNVTWAMHGKNKYPMNFINLFIDKMLGKDMEESLGNLKQIMEGNK